MWVFYNIYNLHFTIHYTIRFDPPFLDACYARFLS